MMNANGLRAGTVDRSNDFGRGPYHHLLLLCARIGIDTKVEKKL